MRCRVFPSLTAALVTSLSLQACAPSPSDPPPPIDQQMEDVLTALDRTGMVRFPMVRPGSVLPAELERPFNWHWTGALEDGVKEIATRVGYRFLTSPSPPHPSIRIDRDQTSAAALLDALASASTAYATIDVDIRSHTIRVSWHA